MAIGLSEEHQDLRESVRGWAERNIPKTAVRAAIDEDSRPAFWAGLADQGLLGLHIPEDLGGQGFGLLEACVAVEEMGHAVAPGPYVPTVLASAALLAADDPKRANLLPDLADGVKTAAVSLAHGMTGELTGGGLMIRGTSTPVLGATQADVILLPVATDKGEAWVAVDADQLTVETRGGIDITRRVATVKAEALAVPAERVLDGLEGDEVLNLAAIVFGAEACGLAGWEVDAAAEYARVREQFGRPIGQFQGVKHKAAKMLMALEQGRAVVWDAARAHDEEQDAPRREDVDFAASVAGLVALDAAVQCGADAIQIHGGIGYTYEHDLHLYYRRALTLRALLGDSGDWARSAGTLALNGTVRELEIDLPEEAPGGGSGGQGGGTVGSKRTEIRAELAKIAELPKEQQKRALADGGWSVPHFPVPWGRDATPMEQVIIHQELRAARLKPAGLAIGAWVVPSLVAYGSEKQKQRFLPPTFRGELMWCQLFSEPGAGSDLASIQMKAERVEGGWRLTGQKIWTSVAQYAQWGICLARTSSEGKKHDGITYFLVDMKAPGVEVRPLTELTGENLFNEVFMDGVFVPDDLVVGSVGDGWRVARNTLSNERVSLGSSTGTTAGVAWPDLLGLARERTPLGESRLEHFGRITAAEHAIAALGLRVTLRQVSGLEPGADASVRKLLAMQQIQHIAEFGWSLLGTAGVLDKEPSDVTASKWSRGVLAARALTIYGGTTEVQLNVIGERMLGLPRD